MTKKKKKKTKHVDQHVPSLLCVVTEMCTAHQRDQVELFKWILSAWAHCHARLFRSHLHPIMWLARHFVLLSFFFFLLRARGIFQDEKY